MSIRRGTAYLGLLIGVALLIWAGLMPYSVHYPATDKQGSAQQPTSINGYGMVREAARDGLVRDKQGRLLKRDKGTKSDEKKDANTCYT